MQVCGHEGWGSSFMYGQLGCHGRGLSVVGTLNQYEGDPWPAIKEALQLIDRARGGQGEAASSVQGADKVDDVRGEEA
jgi:hypothetical protein